MAVQRCTVHKRQRNLLAHAPERLHEEISNDYRDMIYAATRGEVETRRKAFIRKWRLKSRVVADSLEEAGDKLFTFTRFPPSQWKSIRTSNAIERLHEEFKRRIKTSDRAALRRHRRHAVLGAARLRTDHHAQGRRMAHPQPRNQTIRSLTSPHDRIPSCRPKTRHPIPTQVTTGPSPHATFIEIFGAVPKVPGRHFQAWRQKCHVRATQCQLHTTQHVVCWRASPQSAVDPGSRGSGLPGTIWADIDRPGLASCDRRREMRSGAIRAEGDEWQKRSVKDAGRCRRSQADAKP